MPQSRTLSLDEAFHDLRVITEASQIARSVDFEVEIVDE